MGGRRGKNVPNLGEGLVASKLNEATNELVEGTVCHRRVKMGVDDRLESLERKGHQVCCWQQIKKWVWTAEERKKNKGKEGKTHRSTRGQLFPGRWAWSSSQTWCLGQRLATSEKYTAKSDKGFRKHSQSHSAEEEEERCKPGPWFVQKDCWCRCAWKVTRSPSGIESGQVLPFPKTSWPADAENQPQRWKPAGSCDTPPEMS